MPSVRVVPPFNARGVLTLAALGGALCGWLLFAFFAWLTSNYPYFDSLAVGLAVLLHTVLGPPFIAGVLLARLSARPRTTTLAGLTFGAAQAIGIFAYDVIVSRDGGAMLDFSALWGFLAVIAIGAAISTGAFHLGAWLTRSLIFTVVEQTGAICHSCGYDRGGPAITACPECATPAEPNRFRARLFLRAAAAAQSLARPALALLLVIFLVAAAVTIRARTLPALRFVRTMEQTGAAVSHWYITPQHRDTSEFDTSAIAAWLPFPDGSDRNLLVLYAPDRASPEPAMQLVVVAATSPVHKHSRPDYGAPNIAINLPRDLAERVVTGSLPASLLQAFNDMADIRNWKPSGGLTPLTVDAQLDPAPHFAH